MLSERWRGVSFSHRVVARKHWFLQTLRPKSWRPDGLVGLSVLQLFKIFYVVLRSSETESVAKGRQGVAAELHKGLENPRFDRAHRLLIIKREYE